MSYSGIYEVYDEVTGKVILSDMTLTKISSELNISYNTIRKAAYEGRPVMKRFYVRTMKKYADLEEARESKDMISIPFWTVEWNRITKGAELIRTGRGRIATFGDRKYVTRC